MERLKIGKQIAAARKQRGWDQATLAKRVGVPQCQISRIENDKDCRLSTLTKIVKELDIMIWL